MSARLTTGALIVLGVALMVAGGQRWVRYRSAARVVDTFVDAVREGDPATLVSVMHPEVLPLVQHQISEDSQAFRQPCPGLEHRIHHIEFSGARARAQLVIERGGFVAKPTVTLGRNPTGVWKVLEVDGLAIDPRWYDLQQQHARQAGDSLAAQLTEALERRHGVEVRRVSVASPDALPK